MTAPEFIDVGATAQGPDSARMWRGGGEEFDRLRDGLRAGLFGGLPIDAAASQAMMSLLAHLGWRGGAAQMAHAMPHFPDAFGAEEMMEVVARLGYLRRRHQGAPGDLEQDRMPALHVAPNGRLDVCVDRSGVDMVIVGTDGMPRVAPLATLRGEIYLFHAVDESDDDAGDRTALGALLSRFGGPMRLMLMVTLVINLFALMSSLAVMALYDAVIPTRNEETLLWLAVGLVGAAAVELALRTVKARMIAHIGGRLEFLTATLVFGRLLGLPLERTGGQPVTAQLTQLRQFESLREVFVGPFVAIGLELPFVLLFLVALAIVSGPLVLAPALLILAYVVAGALLAPALRRHGAALARATAERDAHVGEMMTQMRAIRAIAGEKQWLERGRKLSARAATARRGFARASAILRGLAAAGPPLAGVGIVAAGAVRVMENQMSVGALIAAMIIVWRVLSPIQQAFLFLTRLADLSAAFRRFNQFMTLPTEHRPSHGLPLGNSAEGEIRFVEATFRYPRASRPAVLAVDLTVPAGSMAAVMGPTASGKTTMLRMALGLFHPQAGGVTMDGVDLRLLDLGDVRRSVSLVPQQPALFHGTLAQNLRLAAPAATDRELQALCGRLGLAEQIERLPEGLDTRVTDLGRNQFSHGLRQMLAIGQALLRRPRVLLMDEPANGLDAAQEAALLDLLREMRGRTTVMMVTHRPSHARLADKIIVMHRGRLVGDGPPDQVLQQLESRWGRDAA